MLGEKRGESLFFQTEKAAEPKPVVMELQMVERGVQAVESHQPDHNRISATGTLNHPQKENKRPGMESGPVFFCQGRTRIHSGAAGGTGIRVQ